ncbi:MAG TPA: plastocyanin/azurin family copper-binding protein [Actinomycetota bacterium]|nr:plastocyanin/azurin family copper-binding protein [Actinomycetota bacterium]
MKRSARLILAVAAAAAFLPPAGARAATLDVSIQSSGANEFNPTTIVVHVGDYVRWTNDEHTLFQKDHNVTADDGSFSSKPRMKKGDSFEFQFTSAGTFPYHCTLHGLSGTVDVVAPRPSRAASATPTPRATRTTRPKPSKSATASPTPDASPNASSTASIAASGLGSNLPSSAGAIISIAIVSIVVLALLGWFVYTRYVRQD